ncbi:hypothetical protein NDU88_008700 [Pleurodeles waltl]|uniref:Uncharacterized protein n=1 Tax=Pleurodeles waltl TaxID=8319 RepID=A0AAV7PPW6_PLEWA|nr:hypothetical protein NDU88_008700 [Pleurodeles waltl]
MADRDYLERAAYCDEGTQEDMEYNADSDALLALEASVQHSINKALAAALRPITAMYTKVQSCNTSAPSNSTGESSEAPRKHKEKSKCWLHEEVLSSLDQKPTEDHKYCTPSTKH